MSSATDPLGRAERRPVHLHIPVYREGFKSASAHIMHFISFISELFLVVVILIGLFSGQTLYSGLPAGCHHRINVVVLSHCA